METMLTTSLGGFADCCDTNNTEKYQVVKLLDTGRIERENLPIKQKEETTNKAGHGMHSPVLAEDTHAWLKTVQYANNSLKYRVF